MDLVFFCVILAVTQTIITRAASGWFADQIYVVSPAAAVTAIVMMRWGLYAAIPAAVGGLVISLASGGSWIHILIYGAGNLAALGAMLLFRVWDRQAVRDKTGRSLGFAALVQGLMLLGRALAALLTGRGPEAAWGFITTDTLSIVFTMVVIWIARRVDGLFEDQKHYLRRIRNELDAENDMGSKEQSEDQSEGGGPV